METAESPLEVLSRAAVMLQRNVLPPPSYDEARSMSQQQKCIALSSDCSVPTTTTLTKNEIISSNNCGKWKREKKYQHKLNATTLSCDSTSNNLKCNLKFSSVPNDSKCYFENRAEPLDMSKRTVMKDRGDPPSYFQSILCSSYARPNISSVISSKCKSRIVSLSPVTSSEDKETMCDQVINEHFRRSLGGDYMSIFSSSKSVNKEQKSEKKIEDNTRMQLPDYTDERTEKKNLNRCISPSPLSVDDHFAKALGDTWKKLQQQQYQLQNQKEKPAGALYLSHEKNRSETMI